MRGRRQLELLPGDYKEAQAGDRRTILRRLLAELNHAKADPDSWYHESLEFCRAFNRRPLR